MECSDNQWPDSRQTTIDYLEIAVASSFKFVHVIRVTVGFTWISVIFDVLW